ncbi:MAG TPA: phosphate acyltransferase PlsX [Candidatus Binataceae bacterium]|nr:phosphate acyltransferase PlsX [Candidatus Binataceae bacterium]
MRIALDAMGGDLAPKATVEGAVAAARDFGIEIVLVGDLDLLTRELTEHKIGGLKLTVEHAPESVAMDDSPLESVLNKPHSSIHVGLEMVKRGDASAFVSAGNSGAVMAAAMMILGTLPGVDRPAIASLVPASDGFALLIDAGANTEVKPLNLAQFAVMGSVYSHRVRSVPNPRVGILANGEEDSKGTDLTRAAAAILRGMRESVDYIGYVEGRDINRGKADVVVTDGFTGNVALKTMEGFASFLLGNLRDVFGTFFGRIAYLLVRRRLTAIRERLDPSEYGGAPLLGLAGVTIIAHGSSNPRAIRNAIRAAANEALVERVNAEIVEMLARDVTAMPVKSAGKGFRALLDRMRERLHRHPRDGVAPPAHAAAAPSTTPSAAHPANAEHPGAPAAASPGSAKVADPEHPPHETAASVNGAGSRTDAAPDEAPDDAHKTGKEEVAESPHQPESQVQAHKPDPS